MARAGAADRACSAPPGPQRRYKILDTSVIIDGRIADLCDTGFMDGTLVIPQFVLKELQLVADSADSMKRNRGRRGLDILQKVQKMSGVEVTISDVDYPEVREVDLKLIELARTLQGKIVTNDFNLNKVAQLRGVDVLNINELANALKPVVLPGEIMKVFVLKEGKEYNQGVAYLDDGTMVVVDNARKMISKTIDIVVTSVLQTTAGKMIFGRYIDPNLASQAGSRRRRSRDEPQPHRRGAIQPAQPPAPGRSRPRPTAAAAHGAAIARRPEPEAVSVESRPGASPASSRAEAQRRRQTAIDCSTVPLVAHSLLADPDDRDLHDRARHAVDRLQPVRSRGLLRALVCACLVVADSGDDRRARVRCVGLDRLHAGQTYVFVANHQSIYDIPVLFASLPYQLRIIAKESLGSFPFLGWHLQPHRSPAGRSPQAPIRGASSDGRTG